MKKVFCFLGLLLFSKLCFFADAGNIVYLKTFAFDGLETVEIALSYENLSISQIYGEEIVVEISSNNLKRIPLVDFSEDQDGGFLRISSPQKKPVKGNYCTVYLYLPQDFNAKQLKFSAESGSITSQDLKAENSIYIKSTSGKIKLSGCTTEFFSALSLSGSLSLQKLNADFFDINTASGNIFIELDKNIRAKSKITSQSGKIQLYYKKNESPFADDSSELIISSITGRVETQAFDSD